MTTTATKPDAPSAEALLKAAVSGAAPKAAAPKLAAWRLPGMPRAATLAATGAALLCGACLGFGAAVTASSDAPRLLAEIAQARESDRAAAARTSAEIERLGTVVASLREAVEAGRREEGTRSAATTDRMTKLEQAVTARLTALGDRVEQAGREQTARTAELAAQFEKRPAPTSPVAVPAKPEPVQTGSIPEAKAKPTVIEGWALRDVYGGTAILEDRRRRLVEVAAGDTLPGIGRVDGIERRGREWIVVTRQGIVTSQPW